MAPALARHVVWQARHGVQCCEAVSAGRLYPRDPTRTALCGLVAEQRATFTAVIHEEGAEYRAQIDLVLTEATLSDDHLFAPRLRALLGLSHADPSIDAATPLPLAARDAPPKRRQQPGYLT